MQFHTYSIEVDRKNGRSAHTHELEKLEKQILLASYKGRFVCKGTRGSKRAFYRINGGKRLTGTFFISELEPHHIAHAPVIPRYSGHWFHLDE